MRAADLLDVAATPGEITENGVRTNISVGLRYLEAWLRGSGAVGIDNLMEDAATAEISRSQLYQWVAASARLADGRVVTAELVREILAEEVARLRAGAGQEAFAAGRWADAIELFEQTALGQPCAEFLTLPAYGRV